jgi:hypothetical protein
MTSPSPSTPSTNVVTALDHRIEAAVGRSIEQLWQHRERQLLDDAQTRLADAHHGLVTAERAVTFHRLLLARLASGEFEVDEALCARIDRTVGQLAQAVAERDAQQATAQTALEAVEKAARTQCPEPAQELSAPDFAALLAIAHGAKLREHLLTQRLSVVTASGRRVAYHQFQRFEAAGLVVRDDSHPLHAGQPVTLTDAGRTLLASPQPPGPPTVPSVRRAGAWPAPSAPRR